jgi:hypothetical protein
MSKIRTQPTESATKRNISKNPYSRGWRETRAEIAPPGPLLEYSRRGGDRLRDIGLFFGGEFTAG